MQEVHSLDYGAVREQAARGVEPVDAETDDRSAWPWVLGCAGFWLCVALAVMA
jgi:hypothetical protein